MVTSWTRLVLPEAMAGMLRVRRRSVDVVGLTLLGAGLLVLAVVVPERYGTVTHPLSLAPVN
ncbi:MAG: DUF3017 domain-containing protein [Nocardioidaceae bacterium]